MTASPPEPLVSVVMPVHNALPHLDDAIRSILGQTYSNFEFVAFDDGSTDGSTERLRHWASQDARIRLIESKENLGPAVSSNRVVAHSSAPLIARMDADDVCHPKRLARQVELLRQRSDVCLVATSCDVIGARGETIRGPDVWRLTRRSWFAPFAHGSALFRRDSFDAVGGYRAECVFWEDQDLFVRMLALSGQKIVTIPATLYRVRYSPVSTRVASDQDRVERAVDLMYRSVDRLDQCRWYDDLLSNDGPSDELDPRVFIAVGSLELWAQGRPRYVRRLLRNGRLRWDFKTLSTLAWTTWAYLSPTSLRFFMKLVLTIRNLAASMTPIGDTIEWAPRGVAELRSAPRSDAVGISGGQARERRSVRQCSDDSGA